MTENNLPYHVRLFNDKVKVLNQTNGKLLTLNPQEARSLHAEIYDLMATIASLSKPSTNTNDTVNINMDGGTFK
jgi:hypothetical protein